MSLGQLIEDTVRDHIHGDVVDIIKVAEDFGCVIVSRFEHSTFKGVIRPSGNDEYLAEIALNEDNTEEVDRTVVALLLAEQLINSCHGRSKKAIIETFYLSELRKYRMSPSLMLATRIAIPKHIMKMIDYPMFNTHEYAIESKLTDGFVSSAFEMSNSWFVKTMNSMDLPSTSRVMNIRKKSDLHLAK